MKNFLQYTNLTMQDIINAISAKLSSDPKFDNFRESAISQILIEIFAACTDMNNYYLQRRSEESFLDTAKLKSSVILLSKLLGYSITRPIPAEAKIKIKISGDLTTKNITAGDILQIPIYSQFSYDNIDLLLKSTFQYTFTSTDISEIYSLNEDYKKDIILNDNSENIYLIQGIQKTKIIEGSTNTQVGQKFQKYKIEDKTFSNKFGSEDYDIPITNVWVGSEKSDNTKYNIDRRSLVNWDTVDQFINGDPIKVCLIKTSNDENIELDFGDAKISDLGANLSAVGAETTYDNIYIDYLSTLGANGNHTGIINESISSSVSLYINGDPSKDITSNTEFFFYSNLIGGSDIETIDEIRHNAPNIFYTMDRLVSKKDYINYLKSLSSPINFKNVIAWGEQEEINNSLQYSIKKLFNVAMFCAIGSMYNLNDSNYTTKESLEDVVLDLDFDEDGISYQSYWNVYMKQTVIEQLKYYETTDTTYILYGDKLLKTAEEIAILHDNDKLDIVITSQYSDPTRFLTITTSEIPLISENSYEGIASKIQEELLTIIDLRGTESTNPNYNKSAFTNLTVNYDSYNNKFIIKGDKDDPCFIYLIAGNNFATNLRINKTSTKISLSKNKNIISTNLSNLIKKINKKSQLTVRNVYISPIIQKFNLVGNIYIKNFSDREDLHRKIKNSIYSWLDINADFNTPIYISNITELIEEFPEVLYSNIKFEPFLPSLTEDKEQWFNPKSDERIEKYGEEKNLIYTIFDSKIKTFLNDNLKETIEDEEIFVWEELSSYKKLVYSNEKTFLRKITERTFFADLVKNIYDSLSGTKFRDSEDFLNIISDMHKDLIFIIRYNMLDSNGNIAPEYTTQVINNVDKILHYRGGYSMQNEIVKVNINTNILYKNN